MIHLQSRQTRRQTILAANLGLETIWNNSSGFEHNVFCSVLLYVNRIPWLVKILWRTGRVHSVSAAYSRHWFGLNLSLRQTTWHPNIKLLIVSSCLQMVENGLVTSYHLLEDVKRCRMPVWRYVFHDLFVIRRHLCSTGHHIYCFVLNRSEFAKPYLPGLR